MIGVKIFFNAIWFLCYLLLNAKETKAGPFKDFYACYVTHVCECGLLDQYNQCYLKAPQSIRHLGADIFRDYFPGNFTGDDGLIPFTTQMCKDKENELFFKIWDRTEKELRAFERKMVMNLMLARDSVKTQTAKACVSPLIARCIEYGNACR
ncbi:hypothetical protein HNY73_008761 [Argiope bruennichi]|uniref:Uncharacterized protein n=1 Tax=Argiope bruennichi TaxID=94029 RepID=A0A8T0FDY1_ARGBR|nr:hypothetical protein HNY73_008761 [Argiope bruennichi]